MKKIVDWFQHLHFNRKELEAPFIVGRAICSVCGFEFLLDLEKHYISRDETDYGFLTTITTTEEPCIYDTVDCPLCGCQNILQKRKRKMEEDIKI